MEILNVSRPTLREALRVMEFLESSLSHQEKELSLVIPKTIIIICHLPIF
ncbi:hypothetical protein KTC93_09125 [Clostridium tagluense]|nr:hypothetical protein [Clostridium tagluense]WLC67319.1 hypothetical protein KTC93_09125 [Clostridium tagluense]